MVIINPVEVQMPFLGTPASKAVGNTEKQESCFSNSLKTINNKINTFINKLSFGNQLSEIKSQLKYIDNKITILDLEAAKKENILKEKEDQLESLDSERESKLPALKTIEKQLTKKKEKISKEIEDTKKNVEELENLIRVFPNLTETISQIHLLRNELMKKMQDLGNCENELLECNINHDKNPLTAEINQKLGPLQLSVFRDGVSYTNTYNQLISAEKKKNELENRLSSLNDHISKTSLTDKIKMTLTQTAAKINLIGFLSLSIIHPASVSSLGKDYISSDDATMTNIYDDVKTGKAESIQLYTEKHQQIQGYVIYGNPNDNDKDIYPTLVWEQGNSQTAEEQYQLAKAYAKEFNVNVVLHNPPGVGSSLGTASSTQDAVDASKAAVKYTLNRFCKTPSSEIINYNLCAVYGHSLGGGITATALKELVKEKALPENSIGLYVNHHSFSSLQGYIPGKATARTDESSKLFNLGEFIGKLALKLIGHNTLDTYEALTKHKIAKKTIVATAHNDELMEGQGQLKKKQNINKTDKNISYITTHLTGHGSEYAYVEGKISEQNGRPNKLSSSEYNEKKTSDNLAIAQYKNEFKEWADGCKLKLNKP